MPGVSVSQPSCLAHNLTASFNARRDGVPRDLNLKYMLVKSGAGERNTYREDAERIPQLADLILGPRAAASASLGGLLLGRHTHLGRK